jgi:hypothetical protein
MAVDETGEPVEEEVVAMVSGRLLSSWACWVQARNFSVVAGLPESFSLYEDRCTSRSSRRSMSDDVQAVRSGRVRSAMKPKRTMMASDRRVSDEGITTCETQISASGMA